MKKKGTYFRRSLSVLLSLVLVFTMLLIGLTSAAGAPHSLDFVPGEPPAATEGVVFLAPEVIYLQPSTADVGAQVNWHRFADQYLDGSPRANVAARTVGTLYFNYANADSVVIELVNNPAGVTVNHSAIPTGTTTVNTNLTGTSSQPARVGTAPTYLGGGYLLTWRATYVVDGVAHTAYTFSYVYRPIYTPTALFATINRGERGSRYMTAMWTNGLHRNFSGPHSLWPHSYHGTALPGFNANAYNQRQSLHTLLGAGLPNNSQNAGGDAGLQLRRQRWFLRNTADNAAGHNHPGTAHLVHFRGFADTSLHTTTRTDHHMQDFYGNAMTESNTPYFWAWNDSVNTPHLFVDTSRHASFDQIPNLSSYMIQVQEHRGWGERGGSYDFIGWNARTTTNNLSAPGSTGTRDFYPWGDNNLPTANTDRGAQTRGLGVGGNNAARANNENAFITGAAATSAHHFGGTGRIMTNTAGLRGGAWNIPVQWDNTNPAFPTVAAAERPTTTIQPNPVMRSARFASAGGNNSFSDTAHFRAQMNIIHAHTNRQPLRDAFNETIALGLQRDMFRPQDWDIYFTALTNVAMGLMRVDHTPNVTALVGALNSAVDVLLEELLGFTLSTTVLASARHMNIRSTATPIFTENLTPVRNVGDFIIGRQQANAAGNPNSFLNNPTSTFNDVLIRTAADGGVYSWVYVEQFDPTYADRRFVPAGTTFHATHENLRVPHPMNTGNVTLTWRFYYTPRVRVQYLANGGVFAGGGTTNNVFYVLPADNTATLPIYNAPEASQGTYLRPTRAGYAFAGWRLVAPGCACDDCECSDCDCADDVAGAVVDTAGALQQGTNHRLIAQWVPAFELRYVLNSGVLAPGVYRPVQMVIIDGNCDIPDTPEWDDEISRINSILIGWDVYFLNHETGEFEFSHHLLGPEAHSIPNDLGEHHDVIELRAVWESTPHNIRFVHNDGTTNFTDERRDYGEELGPFPTLTRAGFQLVGWYDTPTFDVEVFADDVVQAGLVGFDYEILYDEIAARFYARWEASNFTVTFDANVDDDADGDDYPDHVVTGTTASPQTFTYGAPPAPLNSNGFVRVGFTFEGWATSPEGAIAGVVDFEDEEEVQDLTNEHNGNIPLYAVWAPIQYTVTYNIDPAHVASVTGDMSDDYTEHYFNVPKNLRANAFARPGFAFYGWTLDPDPAVGDVVRDFTNSQSVVRLTAEPDDIIPLFAMWTPLPFTVNFMDGDELISSETEYYGDDAEIPDYTTLTPPTPGYVFGGWWTYVTEFCDVEDDYVTIETRWPDSGDLLVDSALLSAASLANNTVPTNVYIRWVGRQLPVHWNLAGGHYYDDATNTANIETEQTYSSTFELPNQPLHPTPGVVFVRWVRYYERSQPISGTTVVNANSLDELTIETGTIPTMMIAVWAWDGVHHIEYHLEGGNVDGNTGPILFDMEVGDEFRTVDVELCGELNCECELLEQNMPQDPVKTGHRFLGWFSLPQHCQEDEENCDCLICENEAVQVAEGDILTEGLVVDLMDGTEVTVFFAHWARVNYNIVFDLNGGNIADDTENPTDSLYFGDEIELPTEPTRDGFIFDGWWFDDDEEIVDGRELDHLILSVESLEDPDVATVYVARWIPIDFTVIFDAQGGEFDTAPYDHRTDTVQLEDYFVLPNPEPTKYGYDFMGWHRQPGGIGGEITSNTVASTDNINMTDGDYVLCTCPECPYDCACEFECTYNCACPPDCPYDCACPINCLYDCTTCPDPLDCQYNCLCEPDCSYYCECAPDCLYYCDCELECSYDCVCSEECEPVWTFEPTVFFAHWMPRSFTLTFDPQGGTQNRDNQSITFGETLGASQNGTFATATRAGFTFAGWHDMPQDHADAADAVLVVPSDVLEAATNMTVYAWWTPRAFQLHFGCAHATPSVPSIDTLFGEAFGTLATIERSGHEFVGWFVGDDLIDENSIHNVPRNMNAVARWTTRDFVFDFIGNGGTPNTYGVPQTYGVTVNRPANANLPTRLGYTFTGWNTEPDGSGIAVGNATIVNADIINPLALADNMVSSDIPTRIYAQWARDTFNLRFDLQGGNIGGNASHINTTVELEQRYEQALLWPGEDPAVIVRDGYVFLGWYTTPLTGGSRIVGTMYVPHDLVPPPGVTTLFARWFPAGHYAYHVHVYLENTDGTFTRYASQQYYAHIDSIVTRTGDYWGDAYFVFDAGNPGNVLSAAMTNDGSTELILHYRRAMVSLYVDLNGENAVIATNPAGEYRWGQQLTVVEPTRPGWVFQGWRVIGAGSEMTDDVLTLGRVDTTIVAQWQTAPIAVVRQVDNHAYYDTLIVELGMPLNTHGEPTDPTLPGWHFIGWSQDLGETFLSATCRITRLDPIDAIFVRVYTVTYDATYGAIADEGGQTSLRQVWYSGTFGQGLGGSLPVPGAERLGYHHVGWFLQHNGEEIQVFTNTVVPRLNALPTHNPSGVLALSGEVIDTDSVIEARWELLRDPNHPEDPDLFPWWILLLIGIPAALVVVIGLVLAPVLMILASLVPGRLLCWYWENCDPATQTVQLQQPLQGAVEQLIEVTQTNSVVWGLSLLVLLIAGGALTWLLLQRRKQSKVVGE
ncbi:MAG: InlB B-repeat-containing protein [Oscillospiraceae bacterium]|nr:InlB B-repeat-containing protein [Oscillospiraceae bacterium]